MLKAYIANPRWSGRFMPSGTKIVLVESQPEAEKILQQWTEDFLRKERQKDPDPKFAKFSLEWDLEERPLKEGILFDEGIQWLSETP